MDFRFRATTKTGVFRSLDAGRTWTQLDRTAENLGRIGVRVAPSNSNVVYVVAESNDGTLFRSDDRGDHFRNDYQRIRRWSGAAFTSPHITHRSDR